MNQVIAGRYKILSSLGEGGMADVYLAMDTILNREVAVKVLRGELSRDPVTLLRFQREASAVSKLNHPNVVDVYDVGEYEGRHYIVMEYIRGRTLKQLISQRGALEQKEAVSIMIQLTSAVVHAHEHNIIHRDIKPQNVLMKDDGTVKITDFGIALAHDAVQLTQSDAVLGSAHYLAPETTKGETPTNQVDIYALGIVFYELLCGSVPFRGDNPVQIAMKHLHEEIPSVREFNPMIWQSVENIIIKATVKKRSLRYQSAKEMLYDLEHCLDLQHAHDEVLVLHDKEEEITKEIKTTPVKNKKVKEKIPSEEIKKPSQKDKKRTWIIGGCVAALVVVLIIAALSVGLIQKGKNITMPDVLNVTRSEAVQILKQAGFEDSNITIKEILSDDIEKGNTISVSPKVGEKVNTKDSITLEVSKGTYFVVEDYTNQKYEDVALRLAKENPNLKLIKEEYQTAELKAGYIIQQSGLEIGQKIDPDEEIELHVVVTASIEFKIEGIVGKSVEEAEAILKEKGVYPVLYPMYPPTDSDEEIEYGVVIDVSPKEGETYVQSPDATIVLYYYE